MMAKTHITFGMGCWIGYATLRGLPLEPLPLALVSIGSLLPDIDHPKSKFGRLVPFLSYPISGIFGHRGITHSLFAVAAAAAALYLYGLKTWFVAPLAVGYISHLVGDVLTNSGAPLLWPRKDKVSIPLFNTKGMVEHLFLLALATFVIWMVFLNSKSGLQNSGLFSAIQL